MLRHHGVIYIATEEELEEVKTLFRDILDERDPSIDAWAEAGVPDEIADEWYKEWEEEQQETRFPPILQEIYEQEGELE